MIIDIGVGLFGLLLVLKYKSAGRGAAKQQERLFNALGFKRKFKSSEVRAYQISYLIGGLVFIAGSIYQIFT